MNIQDALYHGIIFQIRRVLTQMAPDEVDAGLSAFEDGKQNWDDCFFARTIEHRTGMGFTELAKQRRDSGMRVGIATDPEAILMDTYNIQTPVPFRIIYRLFDEVRGAQMDRKQLYNLISSIRDESRPNEVMDALRGMSFGDNQELLPEVKVCA